MVENRRVILVAGMHRSGTSAIARFLNLLGPSLPDDIMPASPDNNPLGFWEPRQMVEINNAIFARMEMVWHSLGPLPPDWETRAELNELRQRASAMITNLEGGEYILKDPRISRLMPFWKALFEYHNIPVSTVIPYRNPLEVASSLRERDRFSKEKSLLLWLRYNVEAELNTRDIESKVFLSFDQLLQFPESTQSQLRKNLKGSNLSDWLSVQKVVNEFLRPDAKHHNEAKESCEEMDAAILLTFEALAADESERRKKIDQVSSMLSDADRLVGKQLNDYEWERGQLLRRTARLKEQISRPSDSTDQTSGEKVQEAGARSSLPDDSSPELETRLRQVIERLDALTTSLQTRLSEVDAPGSGGTSDVPSDTAPEHGSRGMEGLSPSGDEFIDEEAAVDTNSSASMEQQPRTRSQSAGLYEKLRNHLFARGKPVTDAAAGVKAPLDQDVESHETTAIRELNDCELFDPDWYLKQYPDVAASGMDPALHFACHGWLESRDPGENFSVSKYLAANPDVEDAGINPLLHYIHHGRSEGRPLAPKSETGLIKGSEAATTPLLAPVVRSSNVTRTPRLLTDLNGNTVELDPVPAFGSKSYELAPAITGPVLILPLRAAQYPVAMIENLRIAVHLHLHHLDLLDEFAAFVSRIPLKFALFVSITEKNSLTTVVSKFEEMLPNARVTVKCFSNRGRDIASLVSGFASDILNYDIFAHFHSKRSMHNPAKSDWRRQLLHNLLGSSEYVRNVLGLFEGNPHLGMVFPEYHWSLDKQISWGENYSIADGLAKRCGIEVDSGKLKLFPAGSMFWARVDALRGLLSAGLKESDFPVENAQVDGTPAHAIERMFGEFVSQAGYHLKQIKTDRQHSLSSYFTPDWPYPRRSPQEEEQLVERYRRENSGRRNRVAVYTAIAGGYDEPLIHEALDPEIDYFLFTDTEVVETGLWKVRQIDYYHPDPVRRARYVKTHPHRLLAGYEIAIWIDANVLIRTDLKPFIEQVDRSRSTCLYGIPHPHRQCVYEELEVLVEMEKDDPDRMRYQIGAYQDLGYPRSNGLIETNFLISDLRHPRMRDVMRRWWGEISRFSYRDQLSVNFTLWSVGERWAPIFAEGQSLRSHPGFAYFGHSGNSGWVSAGRDKPRQYESPRPSSSAVGKHDADVEGCSRPNADIIVCVHDALEDVSACLESVIHSRLGTDSIIIVDDASGTKTAEFLDEFSSTQSNVTVLRNDGPPHGYCRSANIGMRAASSDFVLLLNSDTILPGRAIDKMLAAALSDPDIAIVGPLSNAASTQSIPDIRSTIDQTAVNSIPEDKTVDELDFWCECAVRDMVYPRVPLVHGFCQLIRRSVLDEVGLFDEVAFPQGYGEENDLCFRATNAGYELLIAVDTFVYHAKSASYTDVSRRKALTRCATRVLQERHGSHRVRDAVKAMEGHPVLEKIRAMAKDQFSQWREGVS